MSVLHALTSLTGGREAEYSIGIVLHMNMEWTLYNFGKSKKVKKQNPRAMC